MQKDRFWFILIAVTCVALVLLYVLFAYSQSNTESPSNSQRGEDYFSVRSDQSISDRYLYPAVQGTQETEFPVIPEEQFFKQTVSLPYRPASHLSDRELWGARWGMVSFSERGIELGGERSSFIVFRAGREWDDVKFESAVDWGSGAVLSLAARIADDRNFVECAYSYDGRYARIYHVHDGRIIDVATSPELPTRDYASAQNIQLAIEVEGSLVRCFIEGERVLQGEVVGAPDRGSVGFETWDSVGASRAHVITALSVESL